MLNDGKVQIVELHGMHFTGPGKPIFRVTTQSVMKKKHYLTHWSTTEVF